MSESLPELTPLRLSGGVWEAVLTRLPDPAAPPELAAHCGQKRLEDVQLEDLGDQTWLLRVPVPADCIADGMQVFVVSIAETGEKLGSFAIIAGDALRADFRAELELLRSELDMLKRAFRRHCRESD